MTDALGDRMKAYERVTRTVLLPHSYTVLRVDGRAFHAYLRDADKPFDLGFVAAMRQVGERLCAEVSGTLLGYGQSDEISLLLSDVEPQAQPWFGGVVQKIASVAASVATLALVEARGVAGRPQFDARVFTLPSRTEAENYLIWRQRDAVRNSIAMAAQARFRPAQLHGISSDRLQDMLFREHGINWNDYPVECKRGWVVRRVARTGTVVYTDARTGEEVSAVAERASWESGPAPTFAVGMDLLSTEDSSAD
jgi:tRNA(His) 5'-end guanylyltransferase